MIRVALVSYFNTKPFLDGLEACFDEGEMELQLLPPADCARAMQSGACDLALLPVGSLLDFEGLKVLNHFCIGADGPVDSVFLFSNVPVEQVEKLVPDPHSRTSNGLAAILFRELWQRKIEWITSSERNLDCVKDTTAAVLIGDMAHSERGRFPFVFDLSAEWRRLTGLPFVFAVWVCREGALSSGEIRRVEEALAEGWKQRAASAAKWGESYGYSTKEAEDYLCNRIQFVFDDTKHEAMDRYFSALKAMQAIS